MVVDPGDFLTKVHCPVLAIFAEKDTSIPVNKSIAIYKEYLHEAGNEDVTIELFPDADHTIQIDGDFAPGCYETVNSWLVSIPKTALVSWRYAVKLWQSSRREPLPMQTNRPRLIPTTRKNAFMAIFIQWNSRRRKPGSS